MKNTKLIGLVALLVVVVLVVSVVIATSADNALVEGVNKQFATYQDKIDALQSTIDKLNQGIIDANQALDELKQAGVQIESWNEATPKIPAKLQEALDAYNAFKDGLKVTVGEGEEAVEYTYADHYTTEKVAELKALYDTVVLNIERATSVAAMDEFIANFKTDLTKVETKKAALYTLLATIDEGGVTIADFENVVEASDLFNNIPEALFDAAVAEGEDDEHTTLDKRIDKIYEDIEPLAISAFVDASKALPVAALYAPSNFEAYEKVVLAYDFLVNSNKLGLNADEIHTVDTCQGLVVPTDASEVVLCDFCTERVHLATLYGTNGTDGRHATVVAIKNAADVVNAAIEAEKDTVIAADEATRRMINTLWSKVNTWVTDYSIVTDVEAEDYNAELNALVKRDLIEGYNSALLAKIPELKAAADAFIAEVAKIGNVTHLSGDAIKAASDAFTVFTSKMTTLMQPATADFILGNTTENGVVNAWNKVETARKNLKDILDQIDVVEGKIEDLMSIQCPGHAADVTCDCVATLDTTKVDADSVKAATDELEKLLEDYEGLDEKAIDADLLAVLKTAFVYEKVEAVKKNAQTAYDNATVKNESLKNWLDGHLDSFKTTEITFTLVLNCAGNHGDAACDCTDKKLDKTAIETALSIYTSEELAKYFAQELE